MYIFSSAAILLDISEECIECNGSGEFMDKKLLKTSYSIEIENQKMLLVKVIYTAEHDAITIIGNDAEVKGHTFNCIASISFNLEGKYVMQVKRGPYSYWLEIINDSKPLLMVTEPKNGIYYLFSKGNYYWICNNYSNKKKYIHEC